ncbi:MAG TPA: hypothetical protein DCE78_02960 [Bacteroidetes bacterium]|nr:hypothetical protein [Bacteroidota bacterium]
MMKPYFSRISIWSFVFIMSLVMTRVVMAQVVDYEPGLNLPYSFDHLQLTLEVEPDEATFLGVATWSMKLNVSGVDTVKLLTLRSDIKSVRFNEQLVEHTMRSDSLYVPVPDSFAIATNFKIEIVYKADPQFGVHRTNNGTFWSSFLPGARSDLFPSIPHPDISITTDIRLIVPANWKAIGNGVSTGNTLLPEEKRLFHWKSSTPIPVIDIGMVMGDLEMLSIRREGILYRLYYETGAELPFDAVELLQSSANLISHADSLLSMEYPYESFNMVYLSDHKWEGRSAGGGLSYIFENSGDVKKQLTQDIASQYFGSYHKPATLLEGNHILLYQAWLYAALSDSNIAFEANNWIHYPVSSQKTWTYWGPQSWEKSLQTYQRNQDHIVFDSTQVQTIAQLPAGVYSATDYLQAMDVPDNVFFPLIEPSPEVEIQKFTVNYEFNESTGALTVEAIPNALYPARFIPLTIRKFSDGTINDIDLSISSTGDRITLSGSGHVDNVYIISSEPNIHFTENKPSSFWRYQLRNDEDYKKRLEAADGFGRVKDDPDIQLFLQDIVRNEPDTNVRTILVRSYAQLTNGDSGTQQRFISLLADTSNAIQHEAMEALKRYKGNEMVQQAVYRVISTSPDIPLVNRAIEVYFYVADEDEFFETGRGLLVEDQKDLLFTAKILPLIVKTTKGREFGSNLMQYLEEEFPFFIRNIAFATLKEIEISPSYWEELLPELVSDSDPRVRFLSLELFDKIDKKVGTEILSSRYYNEYDVRVLHQVQILLQDL